MKIESKLREKLETTDTFPCLYINEDRSIVILATERITKDTFAGVVISNNNANSKFGSYSKQWTDSKYKRMVRDSEINIKIVQE